jgi:ubiquinone/menaquinone biosynthesis C-methylase UbiE
LTQVIRYYDWTHRRTIDPARHGVPLEKAGAGTVCCLHPDGFPIFLAPGELAAYDEYSEGDPYSTARTLMSPFQQTRRRWTLELAELALEGRGAAAEAAILDLGCGEGQMTAALRTRFPAAAMAGLDCSVSAIRTAVKSCPGVSFCVADAQVPPFAPASFDLVVCTNLWEHVRAPLDLLAGAARVLRPQGCLLVSTPSRYRLENLIRLVKGEPPQLVCSRHVTEYTIGQVVEVARFGGFELVKVAGEPAALRTTTWKSRLLRHVLAPALFALLAGSPRRHHLAPTVFFLFRPVPPKS